MNIDKLEGAELDRLAYDLGLAPDDCGEPETFEDNDLYLGDGSLWRPSTDLQQAVKMVKEFEASYRLEWGGQFYEEAHAVVYEKVRTFAFASTEALALTRACVRAKMAQSESGNSDDN